MIIMMITDMVIFIMLSILETNKNQGLGKHEIQLIA